MADLIEVSQWEPGIYQLETTDLVEGGADGIDNVQAKQLANRTKYLKGQVDGLGSNKQPLDATLTALAAIVTAADKLIYATGNDTFATTTLTAFARTLLDDVDAATARATLGAAPLASPALTGTPTAPTAAAGTSTTQLATTAFVQSAVAALVSAAPATLDTLNELAAALGNDPNFATTITAALGGKQAADATLTALAAIVTAADKLIYATGNDTFATTTLTAFARTLLDDVDAATMRGTLGLGAAALLAVGTAAGTVAAGDHTHAGFQASDATLTALAGVVTAANKLIYATGADTFATTDLTAFARTLLGAADSTTARSTLGVSTGFASSIAANGYIKLPDWLGGFIIQWGTVSHATTDGTTVSVTFPIAFPNSCLTVNANEITATQAAGVSVSNKTASGCSLLAWNRTGGTAVGSSANWVAIGN